MSRPAFNAANQRKSKGPLYTQRELVLAERYLATLGLYPVDDVEGSGIRVYHHTDTPKTYQAVAHLDELKCQALSSGTVFIVKENVTQATSIWDLAKKQSRTMPLLDRLLRR